MVTHLAVANVAIYSIEELPKTYSMFIWFIYEMFASSCIILTAFLFSEKKVPCHLAASLVLVIHAHWY